MEVSLLRGMAEGADLPFSAVFLPNAFEELDPAGSPAAVDLPGRSRRGVERCTAVSVAAPGVAMLGHNENWMVGDGETVAVVIEIPSEPGAIATVSPTVAACLSAVGMNAAGGAVGVMSLTAPDDGAGVPRVLVSRHALEARDRADALA